MSDIAIQVENISKMYRIGLAQTSHDTLRDRLGEGLKSLFRRTGRADTGEDILWALKDVSFDVKQGEIIGLIGRNGSGKSTLLKILSRITEPTEGQAWIQGRVGSLLEVGTGFHPDLTGRENIFLNGAVLGMKRREIERKFDEIVAFSEVEQFIDTPVKRYSSGMYVRLAFAVAAHLEPEILLVDEVLAVGDLAFQRKCLGKIEDITKGEERTVVFVSHSMPAILNLCTRALLLVNGKAAFWGSADKAVEMYVGLSSQQEYGFADVSHRPRRWKGTRPVIQSVGLRSNNGAERYRDRFLTGEDVVFEIQYDCGDDALDYAFLGISAALGAIGLRVCSVGTHLCPDFKDKMRGKGIVECHVPGLALMEGEYIINAAMGTSLPMRDYDRIDDVMRIKVETGDYFGTGKTLWPDQGYVAQRSQWHVVSE